MATGLPFAIVLIILCFSLKKGLNEYTGIQTFSLKTGKKSRQQKFQIESATIPPVVFEKKRKKKDKTDV